MVYALIEAYALSEADNWRGVSPTTQRVLYRRDAGLKVRAQFCHGDNRGALPSTKQAVSTNFVRAQTNKLLESDNRSNFTSLSLPPSREPIPKHQKLKERKKEKIQTTKPMLSKEIKG